MTPEKPAPGSMLTVTGLAPGGAKVMVCSVGALSVPSAAKLKMPLPVIEPAGTPAAVSVVGSTCHVHWLVAFLYM